MDSGVEFVAVDNPHANKLTVHILAADAKAGRLMRKQGPDSVLAKALGSNIKGKISPRAQTW
jgi:hypothetical protein